VGVTGDDPNGASSTSLRDALLDRISNCDKATVKRGFDDNVRRMPLLLVDGEFLSDSYELEFNQYFEFAACWKRAYARFRDELLNGGSLYPQRGSNHHRTMAETLQHHQTTQCFGLPPASPGNHHPNRAKCWITVRRIGGRETEH
jgi:hypothetical protein